MKAKLSYANVMATVAVFITLGGGAYAATQLPNNSVGTKQLKNGAVTTTKIKNGAVTGAKIKLSTLGTVPKAATVGGQTVKGFSKLVATGTSAPQTALSLNGLTVTLSCAAGAPTVQASVAVSGSLVRGSKITAGPTAATTVGNSEATANVPVTFFTPTDLLGSFILHYVTAAGHRVDVTAIVDNSHTVNHFDGCLLEGTAIGS
jgi:hypothetical protein